MDFVIPVDNRVKLKESKKRDYLDFAKELKKKKTTEHERNGDINRNWCTWNNPQSVSKVSGRLGNKRTKEDHPDYGIIEIIHNTGKCPGDVRRLAVTKTPVKNHQLTLL